MNRDDALRLALEALKKLWLLGDQAAAIANPAIAAIREALEQPKQESPYKVGERLAREGKGLSDIWGSVEADADMAEAQRGYEAAIREALKRPQRELPAGWKLVAVRKDAPADEPDWDDCIRQAEEATGLKVERHTLSIIIREVRRWLIARQPQPDPFGHLSDADLMAMQPSAQPRRHISYVCPQCDASMVPEEQQEQEPPAHIDALQDRAHPAEKLTPSTRSRSVRGQPQQEPVAWAATRLWNRKDTWTCPADIEKELLDGRAPQPAQPQQEPFGWAIFNIEGTFLGFSKDKPRVLARPLYLEAPRTEPQQEPVDVGMLEYRGNSVAFIHQKMTAYRTGIDAAWDAFRAKGLHPDGKTSLAEAIAKYTAPPRREWVGLTDEEVDELSHEMVRGFKSVNWFARAIAARLKERNA